MSTERAPVQDYAPYRKTALDPDALSRLSGLKPGIAVRDTLLAWAQIILAWTACALWTHWWVVLAAIPVIGTRYYSLFIIGHDGLHRRIFPSAGANDLWNDWLVLGPIGAITRLNRHNHLVHHRMLALPEDPDRYKYTHAGRGTVVGTLWRLTGLPFLLRALSNVFLASRDDAGVQRAVPRHRYRLRDVAILGAWQCVLIGGLSAAIGWWAYPVLWLLPVYVFVFAADLSRVFLEHASLEDDLAADSKNRLVTYAAPAWERVLLAPMNMNYHAAHHLWTAIPYYHLPAADALLRASPARDDRLVWRTSYFGFLIEYLRVLPGRRHAEHAAE